MNGAKGWFQKTADETDERGFTTSIGATDEKKFATGDEEIDTFQSTGSVRVMMMKILDFDHINYKTNGTNDSI